MTTATRSWPRRIGLALLILLAILALVVVSNASLRNKAGCLLFINGVTSVSCVVPMPYQLPDEFAEAVQPGANLSVVSSGGLGQTMDRDQLFQAGDAGQRLFA